MMSLEVRVFKYLPDPQLSFFSIGSRFFFLKDIVEIKYLLKESSAKRISFFLSLQPSCVTFFLFLINYKVSAFEFKKCLLKHIIFPSGSNRLNLSECSKNEFCVFGLIVA